MGTGAERVSRSLRSYAHSLHSPLFILREWGRLYVAEEGRQRLHMSTAMGLQCEIILLSQCNPIPLDVYQGMTP